MYPNQRKLFPMLIAATVGTLLLMMTDNVIHCERIKLHVNTETNQFIDEQGRETFFHGVNHWIGYPGNDLPLEKIQLYHRYGLNVIRLAFNWRGVEPERGQYNLEYIQVIKQIVKKMAEHQMYAILDYHQDCYSPRFCGDGAPDWATLSRPNSSPFPEPIDRRYEMQNETGHPTPQDCKRHDWGLYCLSEAAATAYQSFYDNRDGILDAFADMWKFMISEFKSFDNIIGYEIMNEPFPGDVYFRPDYFVPKFANNYNLLPMYDKVTKAIREVDSTTLILFEPITWSAFGSKFNRVPGGEQYQNSSVLSYHYYVPPCTLQESFFPTMKEDIKRLKSGAMVTEFDAIHNTTENMKNLAKTIDFMNQFKQSWCAWAYNGWLLSSKMSKLLSQTYATRVAGEVIQMKFDVETGNYQLTYKANHRNKSSPTVIYLSKVFYYPIGVNVVVPQEQEQLVTIKQPEPDSLHIYNSDAMSEDSIINVQIAPK